MALEFYHGYCLYFKYIQNKDGRDCYLQFNSFENFFNILTKLDLTHILVSDIA